MLGDGSIGPTGTEDRGHAVRLHNEGPLGLGFVHQHGRPASVGHIAHPLAVFPFQDIFVGRPGLAVAVNRRSIVDYASINRPAPSPFGVKPHASGVLLVAASCHVPLFRIGLAVEPVARAGGAVVQKVGERWHQGALLERPFLYSGILLKVAVNQLGHGVGVELSILYIVPAQVEDGLREYTAIFVQLTDLFEQFDHNLAVALAVTGRLSRLVAPLAPAAGVCNRALLLHTGGAGQEKDLGFYLLGIHPGTPPEFGCFVVIHADVDHPVQFGQGLTDLARVGPGTGRVHTPAKEALDVPFVHLVKEV